MAEQYRDETSVPQNPPESVVNPHVRRAAVWTYMGPLIAFFIAIGAALFYFATLTPDRPTKDESGWSVTGTSGGAAPGGQTPDQVPASPEQEIVERGVVRDLSEPPPPHARPELQLTDLGDVLDSRGEQIVGHRVDVQDVNVVDVKDATNFVVQDGNAQVAVVVPKGSPAVRSGQRVNIIGTVERAGSRGIRIRASRVDVRN
jgi:hypothetical protein